MAEYLSGLKRLLGFIKHCTVPKASPFSLPAYLDIVGEYVDQKIKKAEEEGMEYAGGECRVTNNGKKTGFILFSVELYFKGIRNEFIKEGAERELPLRKFDCGTAEEIGEEGLCFNISRPGGEQ